ncbi:MAG: hypothetical protein JWQ06_1295 [Mucilaginibacter sp.]|nr:hypothetical protein [Mucilaginibacter sp.]
MKFHEIYPHNKFLSYIGAILGFIGTYLDNTNKANNYITLTLIISGLVLILLSLRKPKENKATEL